MKRLFWMLLTFALALILLYLSRFWVFSLWDRSGLFGLQDLRPQGGLLARWLRGTPLQPFELIIWMVGFFLLLTGLQKVYDALTRAPKDK
jgi:hypothetical protein